MRLNDDDISSSGSGGPDEGPADGGANSHATDGGADGGATVEGRVRGGVDDPAGIGRAEGAADLNVDDDR